MPDGDLSIDQQKALAMAAARQRAAQGGAGDTFQRPEIQGPSWYERLVGGVGDVAAGGLRAVADLPNLNPLMTSEQKAQVRAPIDKMVEDRAAGEETRRQGAGEEGTDWWRVGGQALASLPMAALGPLAGGAAASGAVSAGEGKSWGDVAADTAVGGVLGKGTELALNAIGKIIAPSFRSAVNTLLDEGVSLTPGMIGGRWAKAAEDRATDLPITGNAVAEGQRKAVDSWNIATLNKALDQVGAKLSPGTPAGNAALGEAQAKALGALNSVAAKITLKPDGALVNDLATVRAALKPTPKAADAFEQELNDSGLWRRIAQPGNFTQVDRELKGLAFKYKSSDEPWEKAAGRAFDGLHTALRGNLARTDPLNTAALATAEKTYSTIADISKAAKLRPNGQKIFTPANLAGHPELGAWASISHDVVGSEYPMARPTARSNNIGLGELLSFAGAAFHPAAALPAIIANAAAIGDASGANAMRNWAMPGPLRNSISLGLRAVSPIASPPASVAGNAMSPNVMGGP